MGLQTFHLVFVAASTVFFVGFGIWGVRDFLSSGSLGNLFMAICSFIGAGAFVVYTPWFLRKLKNIGYL